MNRFLTSVPAVAALLFTLAACGGHAANNGATTGGGNTTGATSAMGEQSPATVASGGMENAPGAVPNCGATKAVWVNTKTHVYHEAGNPMYGNTKHGKYLCPSAAKAEGDRPAGAHTSHKSSM